MTAEDLKNSILHLAVEGKLVPQDPGDEPAAVLLKKIRAEKQKMVSEGKIKKEKHESQIIRRGDSYFEKIDGKEKCIDGEIPFEIPESWEWVRVEFANDIYTGNSINETEKSRKYLGLPEGYNYIGTRDVSFEHKINYNNGVKIPFSSNEFRIAPKGSILLCIEGGSAGRKIAFTNQDVCFGNKLCCFVSHGINYKFLYFYLQCPAFFSAFKDNTSGIIGGVSLSKLKKMLISVPPLAEQKRIVEKIEQLMPLVEEYGAKETELNKLQVAFPENLKKSVLQEAVQGKLVPQDPGDEPAAVLLKKIRAEKQKMVSEGKIKKEKHESQIVRRGNSYFEKVDGKEKCIDDEIPFDIPDTWEWVRLGQLLNVVSDGTHKTPAYTEEGIPFLSVQNVSSGKLDLTKIKYISNEEHQKLIERVHPQLNDILFCRIGTLGKTIKVTWDFQFSIFVSLGLLRPTIPQTADYIIFVINSPIGEKWIQENKVGGGTHTYKINLVDIPKMLIPLPPLAEQKRIVDKIEEIMPQINNLSA